MAIEVPYTCGGGAVVNILLIDDSKFLQRLIEMALRTAGHKVTIIADGEQGRAWRANSFPISSCWI